MSAQAKSRRFLRQLSIAIAAMLVAMGVEILVRRPEVPPELEVVQPLRADEIESLESGAKTYSAEETFRIVLPLAYEPEYYGAATLIASFYSDGLDGVYREDYCKAVQWYERGARRKQIFPSLKLATHYLMGQGVRKDAERAYLWYTQARRLISVYPQYPEINYVDMLDTAEMMLLAYEPALRDPAERAGWDQRSRSIPLPDIPPVIPQPTPDIPFIGGWIGRLFYDSTGCHGELARGFEWLQSIQTQFILREWYQAKRPYIPLEPPKAPTSSLVPEE
jgi:hypothetical protein